MDLATLQAQITATFGARDRARGVDATFRRLVEEIGEVAKDLRGGDRAALALELSDVRRVDAERRRAVRGGSRPGGRPVRGRVPAMRRLSVPVPDGSSRLTGGDRAYAA